MKDLIMDKLVNEFSEKNQLNIKVTDLSKYS